IATRRRPDVAPGFKVTKAEEIQVSEVSQRLFDGPSATGHFVEDEKAQLGSSLTSLLRPDVSLSPPAPQIGFIHRKINDAEIYFLANTSNSRQGVKATFRVEGREPEWWDPFSGRVSPAIVEARSQGGQIIALDLEPYGSRVLVFSRRTLPRLIIKSEPAIP